jgi:putative addiction module CopG family antidote
MNVVLTPQFEAIIRQKIAAGPYADATEVVEEALLVLDERDRLAWLRSAVADGEVGEGVPYTPQLMERLKREAEEDHRVGKPIDDAVKP